MTATKEVLTAETVDRLIPRKVGEIKRERKFNLLIYGSPGAGKTWLAGSADQLPSWRSVLHLDIGGGSATLDPFFPGVETLVLDDWEDLIDQYKKLYFGKDDYDRFNTVILDHLTETQKLCQRWVMAGAIERAKKLGKERELEEEVPEQRQYLIMYERIMQMLRDFRDLDVNFICTAHEKEVALRTGKIKIKPALSGQAKSDIPGLFDIVAYLHTERDKSGKDVRVFSTVDSSDYIAKQRGTELPEELYNPTMQDILSYVPSSEFYVPADEAEGE